MTGGSRRRHRTRPRNPSGGDREFRLGFRLAGGIRRCSARADARRRVPFCAWPPRARA